MPCVNKLIKIPMAPPMLMREPIIHSGCFSGKSPQSHNRLKGHADQMEQSCYVQKFE